MPDFTPRTRYRGTRSTLDLQKGSTMRRALQPSLRLTFLLFVLAHASVLTPGSRAYGADWHEGVLPDVGPLLDSEVIRTEAGRRLFPTPTSDHRFWVRLPQDFNPDEPAGLLLFNHGSYSGADDINPWFHNWEYAFSGENMVWLKMSFRDNSSIEDEHQDSIKYAIAKVAATYKIILGRGILTGFSRGGLAASRLVSDHAGWPFNHILAESMLFRISIPTILQPMSWTFAVGQNEWNSWGMGSEATGRMHELAAKIPDGGSMDLHLHVVEDSGHNVNLSEDTIGPTVAAYRRSTAFLAPFVYQPDFSEAELQGIVDACQDLDLGEATILLAQLIASGPSAGILAKADQLQELLDARVDEMFAILSQLRNLDPVLAEYYATVGGDQLINHPREAEMLALAQGIRFGFGFDSAADATDVWYDEMSYYLDNRDQVAVREDSIGDVMDVATSVYSTSVVGQMTAEFLALNGLVPVPEPSSSQLQLAVIMTLATVARRRRRTARSSAGW